MLLACLPAVAGIGFDLWRIRSPGVNEFVHSLWGRLLKASERNRLTGSSHYFIGIIGAVLLYSMPVAVCASLYMAWADPAALLVGRKLGRRPLGKKTWEGFGAFVAVGFAIGLLFFSWPIALAGAAVAGLVELYTPAWANDNSLVPLAAGLALALLT
jgi:dolichol kinase